MKPQAIISFCFIPRESSAGSALRFSVSSNSSSSAFIGSRHSATP
jgi:hypothetical protein